MTDKEIIRKEIERWMGFCTEHGSVLGKLCDFIDTMPEVPVCEGLEKASKEWLIPQLDKSYASYGEGKMMELTRFDGYAMLDAIEFGANLQKQQMMKNAVDGRVINSISERLLYIASQEFKAGEYQHGDKVKVIIFKEK